MKRTISLLGLSVFGILLSGCTLTPSHFEGYDLLDTEHKTEMQDPVVPPFKESERPIKKEVSKAVAAPTPLVKLPHPKHVEAPKPAQKITEKLPEKPVEKPVAKIPETPPAKPVETCMTDKSKDVPPPAPGHKIKTKHDVLKSSDRLQINVFREKDLTGVYQINDKGMITFPLIGQIVAAGLTAEKLQEKLKTELAKGYLVKPDVGVELLPDCITK